MKPDPAKVLHEASEVTNCPALPPEATSEVGSRSRAGPEPNLGSYIVPHKFPLKPPRRSVFDLARVPDLTSEVTLCPALPLEVSSEVAFGMYGRSKPDLGGGI